jgi:hypothetical protein
MNIDTQDNHYKFKVYLSFSIRRIPELTKYIDDYLKPAFRENNIDYYDFREHERFDYLNEHAICAEIDKNLADSNIFLRFIDHGLEPNKSHSVRDLWSNMRLNMFTGGLSFNDYYSYYDYEIDASYDKFGFTNPYNRFQIVPMGIMLAPMDHIQTIYFDTEDAAENPKSVLNFALEVISKLSQGYQEQRYMRRNY